MKRGLATPPMCNREPLVGTDKDGQSPRGYLCVCSGSVSLGDLLGGKQYVETVLS